MPRITNLITTAALNARINEVKGKIPSITNLVTATAITAFEHKITNVSNLVKETDYTTKTSETESKVTTDQDHDKYITAQKFNKLTEKTLRLAQANLARKKWYC